MTRTSRKSHINNNQITNVKEMAFITGNDHYLLIDGLGCYQAYNKTNLTIDQTIRLCNDSRRVLEIMNVNGAVVVVTNTYGGYNVELLDGETVKVSYKKNNRSVKGYYHLNGQKSQSLKSLLQKVYYPKLTEKQSKLLDNITYSSNLKVFTGRNKDYTLSTIKSLANRGLVTYQMKWYGKNMDKKYYEVSLVY